MRFEPINTGLPRTPQNSRGVRDLLHVTFAAAKKSFQKISRECFIAPVFGLAEHLRDDAPSTRATAIRVSRCVRASLPGVMLFALLTLSACAGRRNTAHVPAARIGATEEGVASWYGDPYHGRRAANGEIFDMEAHTAAHPSLPFETWVRVHHLANKKNTEVRITDRGPFVKGRVIDLSRAAARDIDLVRTGTAKVRLTVIEPPRHYTRGRQFTVQVSSAFAKEKAEALQRQLAPKYKDVAVRYRAANPKGGHAEAWRVLVGREDSPAAAQRILERVQEKFPNAFIVPWDAE